MNKYVCFYNSKEIVVESDTQYHAVLEARKQFKPPKSKEHMVHAVLAEKDGEPVVHLPLD